MPHEQRHNPEKPAKQPSLMELLQARQSLRGTLDGYETQFAIAFEGWSEQALDAFDEDIEASGLPYETYMETNPGDLLPDGISELFREASALQRQYDQMTAQLDRRFAAPLAKHVVDEARKLEEMVDDAAATRPEILGYSAHQPDTYRLADGRVERGVQDLQSVLHSLERIKDAPPNVTYDRVEEHWERLEEIRQELRKWGIPSEVAASDETLAHDEQELSRAVELRERYRTNLRQHTVEQALTKQHLPIHEWAVDVSAEDKASYRAHLEAIDVEAEARRISIDGIEHLPFELSEAQLRKWMVSTIPSIALETVDRVEFRHKPTELLQEDLELSASSGIAVTTLAHHQHKLDRNSAEIVVWLDDIQKAYDRNKGTDEKGYIARYDMFSTLIHEFGHAFHTGLPVALLDEWDKAVGNEEVHVTAYVEHMKTTDHRHSHKEDFADTFRLYIESPGPLRARAPHRYYTMRDLLGAR